MQFRNGIFVISEENQCPLYNVKEELDVNEGNLILPAGKPTCLRLAVRLLDIVSADGEYERYRQGGTEKTTFDCSGCTGIIHFEFGECLFRRQLFRLCHGRDTVNSNTLVCHIGFLSGWRCW